MKQDTYDNISALLKAIKQEITKEDKEKGLPIHQLSVYIEVDENGVKKYHYARAGIKGD